jgi:hypothetical protein
MPNLTLEIIITSLAFTLGIIRYNEKLRALGMVILSLSWMFQLANVFVKHKVNKTPVTLAHLEIASIDHFLKTHPQGQAIALLSNFDKGIHKLIEKYGIMENNKSEPIG